jgi:signal recognition particle subunit SRP14
LSRFLDAEVRSAVAVREYSQREGQNVMVLLENDQFLSEMTKMYQRNRESGSVWTTMKRSLCRNRPKRNAPEPTEEERKRLTCCLVRCSDGKRKISTKVFKNRAEKFSNDFTLVQRASMDGLKADPKKKKEKKKTKVMSSSVVGKDDVVDEQTTATKKKKKKKAKAKAKKEL